MSIVKPVPGRAQECQMFYPMSKKLTISLLVYNGEKYLSFCLDSIFKQSSIDWELVIVDNNSRDDSVKVAQSRISDYGHKVKLVCNEKNIGFAAGHNKVLKSTESEYVLILNQDVILEPDYCAKLVDFLDKHQDVGAAIGKVLRWPRRSRTAGLRGESELTNSAKTDIIDTSGLKILKSFRVMDLGAGERDEGQYNEDEEVFGVSGCCPIYRRETLEDVGSIAEVLDKDFFNYKEDVDLAFRLQNTGWKAYRVGDALAYHKRSISDDAQRKDRSALTNYLSYRNHLFVLIKNLSWQDFWRYGIFIGWYEFRKLIYLLLFERETLYAWVEVIQKFGRMWRKRGVVKPKRVRKWIKK